jgi:colanic acid biosynthesis glycosyl transferase WcaI
MPGKFAMRITLINQTFYPDVVSSGQHLADLALALAERGHAVTVITSRRAYDNPDKKFPAHEIWRGVQIYRVFNTGFGKRAKWRRAADFFTFLVSCCVRLVLLGKPDVIVALTSPPLVSVIAAAFSRLRGSKFCYWIMDLNPDEAVAAGWLSPDSLVAKTLERLSRFSLRGAAKVVVLDDFMQRRILEKGIPAEKIAVIPPWSHDAEVRFYAEGRARFRKAHGLEGKFVIMYAGNHSPCHPLTTILAAAKKLAARENIFFCFIGGGSEQKRVKQFAQDEKLSNVLCLPYQPLDELAGMLSSADLHLVVMGDPFVGLVHPCKAYNLLQINSPILYVGPKPSHITKILDELDGVLPCGSARHGEAEQVIKAILDLELQIAERPRARQDSTLLEGRFTAKTLLPRMVEAVESTNSNRLTP